MFHFSAMDTEGRPENSLSGFGGFFWINLFEISPICKKRGNNSMDEVVAVYFP